LIILLKKYKSYSLKLVDSVVSDVPIDDETSTVTSESPDLSVLVLIRVGFA
jgi:hypothetical protein